MARAVPVSALSRVDLPTLGWPMMATLVCPLQTAFFFAAQFRHGRKVGKVLGWQRLLRNHVQHGFEQFGGSTAVFRGKLETAFGCQEYGNSPLPLRALMNRLC